MRRVCVDVGQSISFNYVANYCRRCPLCRGSRTCGGPVHLREVFVGGHDKEVKLGYGPDLFYNHFVDSETGSLVDV